ncbi:MAG: cytidine deaminase [Clostridium sp.]
MKAFKQEVPSKKEIEMVVNNLKNSYSKYSKFRVSALLKTKGDKDNIFLGVNVENAGIQSVCAERSAFVSAISNGKREFEYLLLVADEYVLPCGYCRQFITEFVNEDFRIYIYDMKNKKISEYTINELLPNGFSFNK